MTDLAAGLAAFLSEEWGRPVTVSHVAASSAGARRANVAFDANGFDDGDGGGAAPVPLVATILPTSAIELSPVAAEAAVRTLAAEHGVPVPKVYATCEDPSYVGGPFFVSARVEGETVPRRVLRLVQDRALGEQVAAQLGEAIARLHRIDPRLAPEGLADPPPNPPAEFALTSADEIASSLLQPRPAISLGLRWLERHLPAPPAAETIVHSDIRNGNLIVGDAGLRAVLDWEGARRHGDPMEDLAWPALRMWRFRQDDREIGGFAGRAPFITAYQRAGGSFDEDRFRWWKVFGTLKWALGLAAQAAAHLDGSFSSIVMAASGRRVPELEWDLLMLIRPYAA